MNWAGKCLRRRSPGDTTERRPAAGQTHTQRTQKPKDGRSGPAAQPGPVAAAEAAKVLDYAVESEPSAISRSSPATDFPGGRGLPLPAQECRHSVASAVWAECRPYQTAGDIDHLLFYD